MTALLCYDWCTQYFAASPCDVTGHNFAPGHSTCTCEEIWRLVHPTEEVDVEWANDATRKGHA